ncbi:hypothetical protein U9M48_014423 [Paspalum notatum var. saurae]|uniref:TPD1 protein n=1 Tax=Paspalum notatum var. saurae TaxID=547442 RepID=A0AAQ3T2S6_PASNO
MRASPSSSSTGGSRVALVASAWLIVLLGSAPLAASDDEGSVDVVAAGEAGVLPSRMDEGCSGAEDIAIYQGHASSLPSGVPAYKVDVVNRCLGGLDGGECAIAGIHIRCGWFSSVSLVDPSKFRRLGHDDCLLNDGRPLLGGETVSFEYANSFPYTLTVRLATCVDPTASSP